MTTPSGWYDDGTGRQRWWDGNQWTDSFQDRSASEGEQPLFTLTSRYNNEDAVAAVYSDRIEWIKKRGGVSYKKLAAGLLTGGMSLAVTGVGREGYKPTTSNEVSILQLATVTGIASQSEGRNVLITVSSPSMAIPLVVPRKDAELVVRSLNNLTEAARGAETVQPVTVQVNASPQPTTTAPSFGETAEQLQKLAELNRMGVLSDAEFAAAKARLLGI